MKWEGKLSEPFSENQGVSQSGIWSPTAYKHFLNPLLDSIVDNGIGLHIGSICAVLVAVADNLLLMADNKEERQGQLNVQGDYAREKRYTVSDTKSKTMIHKLLCGIYTYIQPRLLYGLESIQMSNISKFDNYFSITFDKYQRDFLRQSQLKVLHHALSTSCLVSCQ